MSNKIRIISYFSLIGGDYQFSGMHIKKWKQPKIPFASSTGESDVEEVWVNYIPFLSYWWTDHVAKAAT